MKCGKGNGEVELRTASFTRGCIVVAAIVAVAIGSSRRGKYGRLQVVGKGVCMCWCGSGRERPREMEAQSGKI